MPCIYKLFDAAPFGTRIARKIQRFSRRCTSNFAELKAHFPAVDAVRVEKYQVVVFIFDVGGNKYRVVTRLDFEHRIGFILLIFTHNEYTRWNRAGRPL